GKIKKRSDLFEKNLLILNLRPGTYNVKAEKEGYRQWEKTVTVQEHLVEVCFPLLIPQNLKPEGIPKYLVIAPAKKGQKQKREINEEFTEAVELIRIYDKPSKGIIPGWDNSDVVKYRLGSDRKLRGKVLLLREGSRIYAKWTGNKDQRPFFIPGEGKQLIYSAGRKIRSFGFFPDRNDSMMVLLDDGTLYAVEIDNRFGVHNIYTIMKNCTRFAVSDEILYYVSGGNLYRIDFKP
ncbi:MAG: PEGA domain-containing protein, partial [Spirochaetota bacterium]